MVVLPLLVGLLLLGMAGRGWALELRQTDEVIEVWASDERMVLRYHKKDSAVPEGVDPVYRRSGYIHPVMTPDGREVTGDFTPGHLHHHGIFMAWTSGEYRGKKIDFWNQQKKQGRVAHRKVLGTEEGDGFVSFKVELSHFDQRDDDREILREEWKVTVRLLDGGFYQFDIDSCQRLIGDDPLVVKKHHYGGMAIRGTRVWMGEEACKFLTSEGKARVEANHTRPDWVMMSGEIEGKPAAIAVMGAAKNFRAPQPVRIFPDEPYFCFAPMVEGDFSIEKGEEFRSSYRFLVAGKEMEKAWLDERWEVYRGLGD